MSYCEGFPGSPGNGIRFVFFNELLIDCALSLSHDHTSVQSRARSGEKEVPVCPFLSTFPFPSPSPALTFPFPSPVLPALLSP